jgi:hypothetical protein
MNKQLVVATALALGASGAALADDSSMNPFTGDSYRYFNNGHTLAESARFGRPIFSTTPADPSWRRSHPNGMTERELQALSSSDLSASARQLDPQVIASAPADPSWRRSHPNGFTERELEALSSSMLAAWQLPANSRSTASASTGEADVAQTSSQETLWRRLARFLRADAGANR